MDRRNPDYRDVISFRDGKATLRISSCQTPSWNASYWCNEAGRGMRNGRDGFCKPVAYVLCMPHGPDNAQNFVVGYDKALPNPQLNLC